MKIRELIDKIKKYDLVLPEFQREYVWEKEKAKQLLVSLYKEFPIGGLLLWETDNPPELKNIDHLTKKIGTIKVILDGQQRLTTLYLLIVGEVPPFYQSKDIVNDPRDLFFHLESGDFQYYQSTKMQDSKLWIRVTDCFNENNIIDVFKIAQSIASVTNIDAFTLANQYTNNLTRLRTIAVTDIPEQIVLSNANLEDAINIFDRVNSLGTKLTDAELALTHVVSKWSKARRVIKERIDELSKKHFYFDLTFMTRALTGVTTQRALYELIHPVLKEDLEKGWNTLSKILDYIITILPQWAFIHSTKDVNTDNIFIPLIMYLTKNNGRFPNDKSIKKAIHWLYASNIWARYTAQTDQRLETDVSIVVREDSPWSFLCDQIIDQRGRIEVKSSDLEGRGVQHPLYSMTYILSKAHGAIDWFNGASLIVSQGNAYEIHSHHIFPQSLLYKNGYDTDNHLHRQIVNEIANRAFLTADSNLGLSNKQPEDYLLEIEEKFPGALVKQFIPMDKTLWNITRFKEFLEARRILIANKINEYLESFITIPEVSISIPSLQLITLGESATVEFKSSLQWDIVRNEQNKELSKSVLKTITAFLNSQGGTLFIGVDDFGNILGLENDIKISSNSKDRLQQTLINMLNESIGPEFSNYLYINFENIDDKVIFRIDVDKSSFPAYLNGLRGKEFFIRFGNTSRMLDSEETVKYIQSNWGQ